MAQAPNTAAGVAKALAKAFGEDRIVRGTELENVTRIPSGVFSFDLGTGGGFPKGRISVVWGGESSTKSLLTMGAAKFVQERCLCCYQYKHECACPDHLKEHQQAIWVDAENCMEITWPQRVGLNMDELYVATPMTAEEAVDITEGFAYAEDVGIIVVDSVAALTKAAEITKDGEAVIVGGNSVQVTKMLNKLSAAMKARAASNKPLTVILINQVRQKIGVMFGSPDTMPGGNALRFLSSLTVRLYGKSVLDKAIDPDIPVWKDVTASIGKFKVPIHNQSMEWKTSVHEKTGYRPGTSPSWKDCKDYMERQGDLSKLPKQGQGYLCHGDEYKTLKALEERFESDEAFRLFVQSTIAERELSQYAIAPPEPAPPVTPPPPAPAVESEYPEYEGYVSNGDGTYTSVETGEIVIFE